MMRRLSSRIAATMLTVLAMVVALPLRAEMNAPTQLQIGTQSVRVPVPTGFVETSRRSPELWSQALAFSAGDARIIAHFVTERDLASYQKGNTVVFKDFLLVQTPRRAESLTVTQAQFDKLRSGTVALQSDLSSRLAPRLSTELDRISKGMSSAQGTPMTLRIGEIVPVSVDRNEPNVLIFTVLSQLGAAEGKAAVNQTMVSTTAYCFVSGKVVMLTAYRHFHSPRDLQASRALVSEWSKAVLSTN